MECFLEVFDKARIEALRADREFIGTQWLAWLRR
ncbi:transposase [Rickettsia endosymbiont of Ixodes scapularis]|nr:transposase [Rickettsia endosymbiont of Ixodes scapularis]EER20920.1 transposase [Rickettsia endosymbiont of Ixodes scapularis]